MKVRTTIYIEAEIAQAIKKNNINASKFFSEQFTKIYLVEKKIEDAKQSIKDAEDIINRKRNITAEEMRWAIDIDPNKIPDVVFKVQYQEYRKTFGELLTFEEFKEKFPKIIEEKRSYASLPLGIRIESRF